MHKKRPKTYRNLIDALLNCNEGEEWQLLQAHQELLDSDFLEMMEQVAKDLEDKGDEEGADFLRYLANELVYQDIIAQLLNCASDEEALQILDANRDWVDAGLTQTMLEVAEDLRIQGDLDKSNFLMNIVEQLMGVHGNTSDPQLDFLMQVLQATSDSDGDAQEVYPLLEANIDKLDDRLAELLQAWATTNLAEAKPDEAEHRAATIGNFSNLIAQFPLGDKASNMEIAITGNEITLTVCTRDAFPQNWATTQNNLATAYHYRIRGEKAENLEVALTCYQKALKVRTFDAFPIDWAATQNNLATAYTDRIRGERAENLELAISCCQDALKVGTFDAFPYLWAVTQNNLATAYLERIRGEKAENLELAIDSLQKALKVFTLEAFPSQWASAQNNLGEVYTNRIRGEKAENLELAIDCFRQALKVCTPDASPSKWATTQNNLANAYVTRIRGDKAENLEQAIAYFQSALKVYTSDAFPSKWARTQKNLAKAYRDRIRGKRADNFELAIFCSKNALTVLTFEAFPQYWADLQNHFGAAYLGRIEGDKADNLEQAISYFQNAQKVYTPYTFTQDWALTQQNLAHAYIDRIRGHKWLNLELAIRFLQDTLKIYTLDAFPVAWATTQKNLAIAYRYRIIGEKAENLERAIACNQEALKVYTFYAFPQNHAETLWEMGIAYQEANQFKLAYTNFASAIATVESLREEIVSGEESKRKHAEEWNQLYHRMIETCLELGHQTEAIEYVERSKTRNLVEQILSRDLKTIFPADVVIQLEEYRDKIATGQNQIQTGKAENPKVLTQHLQELRQNRNKLQDEYLPIGSSFQFEHFQNNLDDHTAVVEFYITGDKFLAFIFTHQRDLSFNSVPIKFWLLLLKMNCLAGILFLREYPIVLQSQPKDLDKFGNWVWVNEYLGSYYIEKSNWQNHLNNRLRLLAQILHIDKIIQRIPPECDRLILIPHRYLHLFPLHALPINSQQGEATSEILMDRFPAGVSYAPSCQLQELAQTRKRPNFTHLFAIQNPTGDLSYTNIEVETIKQYFNPADVLVEKAATKFAIDGKPLNQFHCAHFSCHGYFNYEQPRKSALILADAHKAIPNEPNPERYLRLSEDEVLELDKCLTLDAVFALKLEQCRLVTLSACETGLIDFTNISDEYIGLPSGFLVTGSPAVVSSLWTIDDLSTALLMIKFYDNILNQMTLAVALNQAQLWLRDSTQAQLLAWSQQLKLEDSLMKKIKQCLAWYYPDEQPFQKPYHWAAFCAIGE